ncbi:type I-F CRISPR-associated protein Csy3 [Ketobacter sp. MCCC 1A13808]|uniref:type I-F CRISPR-associated protein Csy3 n=1 Tax=Ketobacter sp. MCCC 1A13808 TaxID=2602738 RepID=UPI0012EC1CF9|nr:type I-F CRISPR-associated protein Csy3 [Ketobacter sp. MCCC 1A13808]MVF12273.1 type I-F CRISPR-associated protein Csy3 [Ketobacter sp. MCCC 1A13808]
MAALKTAEVLAFERKLANSDGIMYSGSWSDIDSADTWVSIPVKEKSVRGTISNRQKSGIASDPLKLDKEIQKANLQTVDVAALPFDKDTLKVEFTLRILGNLDIPSACNKPEYQSALAGLIQGYIEENGFDELSKRYALNLANGRFLWRNRVGAGDVCVRVTQYEKQKILKQWKFDSSEFSLRNFDINHPNISELAVVIGGGLKGEEFVFLKIEAFALLGQGQEVFPSEELILNKSNDKGDKSKTLYQVQDIAGLHSQKIGNALRTIDTWYPDADKFGPISVEPFGSVTSRGVAYRQPSQKMDFYSLLDNWVLKGKKPELEQQHYVIAALIRGGVFGEKSE